MVAALTLGFFDLATVYKGKRKVHFTSANCEENIVIGSPSQELKNLVTRRTAFLGWFSLPSCFSDPDPTCFLDFWEGFMGNV